MESKLRIGSANRREAEERKISREDAKVDPEEAEVLQKIGRTEFFLQKVTKARKG